ncbi:hypothetical protein CXG81DRAFT_24745 [Caulochytrium protostelioides]|uniref:Uncharacterized protein n=1 Tax=Caulochytrium protostelioides TaxID=1555241 RepID=A0A4P9XB30_9FUNG|nr:hypothetical protein CXG81DRAFT_24745 [Caulochytrium protostelioides]|eukprot:RKP02604.1 hypothetical protein CXG81DRAFT_24745 [Caulochytrium protostelioides]
MAPPLVPRAGDPRTGRAAVRLPIILIISVVVVVVLIVSLVYHRLRHQRHPHPDDRGDGDNSTCVAEADVRRRSAIPVTGAVPPPPPGTPAPPGPMLDAIDGDPRPYLPTSGRRLTPPAPRKGSWSRLGHRLVRPMQALRARRRSAGSTSSGGGGLRVRRHGTGRTHDRPRRLVHGLPASQLVLVTTPRGGGGGGGGALPAGRLVPLPPLYPHSATPTDRLSRFALTDPHLPRPARSSWMLSPPAAAATALDAPDARMGGRAWRMRRWRRGGERFRRPDGSVPWTAPDDLNGNTLAVLRQARERDPARGAAAPGSPWASDGASLIGTMPSHAELFGLGSGADADEDGLQDLPGPAFRGPGDAVDAPTRSIVAVRRHSASRFVRAPPQQMMPPPGFREGFRDAWANPTKPPASPLSSLPASFLESSTYGHGHGHGHGHGYGYGYGHGYGYGPMPHGYPGYGPGAARPLPHWQQPGQPYLPYGAPGQTGPLPPYHVDGGTSTTYGSFAVPTTRLEYAEWRLENQRKRNACHRIGFFIVLVMVALLLPRNTTQDLTVVQGDHALVPLPTYTLERFDVAPSQVDTYVFHDHPPPLTELLTLPDRHLEIDIRQGAFKSVRYDLHPGSTIAFSWKFQGAPNVAIIQGTQAFDAFIASGRMPSHALKYENNTPQDEFVFHVPQRDAYYVLWYARSRRTVATGTAVIRVAARAYSTEGAAQRCPADATEACTVPGVFGRRQYVLFVAPTVQHVYAVQIHERVMLWPWLLCGAAAVVAGIALFIHDRGALQRETRAHWRAVLSPDGSESRPDAGPPAGDPTLAAAGRGEPASADLEARAGADPTAPAAEERPAAAGSSRPPPPPPPAAGAGGARSSPDDKPSGTDAPPPPYTPF